MIKNNNKRIVSKLALRSIASNKMRNAFILLTIALSVTLLSGITFSNDFHAEETNQQLAVMQHVIYMNVNESQLAQLRCDEHVSDMLTYKQGKSIEEDNYLITPVYYAMDAAQIEYPVITAGSYPQSANEIAVDIAYMERIGKEPVLGTPLSFSWLDGTTETFIISGFTDLGSTQNVYSLLFSAEYAASGNQLKDIPYSAAIRIHDAEQMDKEQFSFVIRDIGTSYGIARPNINENNYFLLSNTQTTTEFFTVTGLGIAILFVSVLVIYSIFYISVTGKVRQFGQLRTLGMTTKQIRQMVRLEGILLCAVGAPIGLLCGGIFAALIFPKGFILNVFISHCIIIFLADLCTVLFSIRKPALIAAQSSPIEASKSSGYTVEESQAISRSKHRLTPFYLARLADKRNRRKSRMTSLSLAVGGILFIAGTTMLASINQEEYSRQDSYRYGEYRITISSNAVGTNEFGQTGIQLHNPISEELIADIKAIPNIKDVISRQLLAIDFEYNDYSANDCMAPFSREDISLLQKYQLSGAPFDYDSMVANREIILTDSSTAKEIYGWTFETGDQILIRWYDGISYRKEYFTVAGHIDKMKMITRDEGYPLISQGGWFIAPEALLYSMLPDGFNLNDSLIISASDYEKNDSAIETSLDELIAPYPELIMYTLADTIAADQSTFDFIHMTVFGFSAFVIGFALINLINTLISNALVRKNEFAMLRSLGMSSHQLAVMIRAEGLLLAVRNILITATLGTAAGYLLILALKQIGATYMHWHFPCLYLIAYCIFILTAPVLISNFVIHFLAKKSLVERLREIE